MSRWLTKGCIEMVVQRSTLPMATILVVDDEAISTVILQRIVEGLHHQAFCAADADEAWQLLQEHREIALVVSDCRLGTTDGRDLVRRMRADSRFAAVPFILISAYLSFGDVARSLAEGASRFLAKPVNPIELAGYIRLLLHEATHSTAA